MNDAPRLRLFGAPTLEVSGRVEPLDWHRPTALAARIACEGGWTSRESLAAVLRPDAGADAAKGYLRRLLHRLAGTPLGDGFAIEPARVRWAGGCDVLEFEDALARGEFDTALALAGRPLLEGVGSIGEPGLDDWVDDLRVRVSARLAAARVGSIDAAIARGDRGEVPAAMQRLLDADPLDETRIQFVLARAQGELERSVALDAYDAFARRLALEMALKPLPATAALAARVRVEAPAATVVAAVDPDPETDDEPTPLLGRECELATIEARFEQEGVRLVTLLGPGGIGKTRLARRVASIRGPRHRDGAAFVELRGVADAGGMLRAIADARGVPPEERDLATRLHAHLAAADLFVVLDNVEQVDGAATAIDRLVAAAPRVRWFVTSRLALGLASEHRVVLAGLATEPAGAAAELLAFHARRLGHPVGEDAADAVERIARQVEGSPLALELAANALGALPADALAAALADDLDLLDAGSGQADPAHRSLRAVFETSWRLAPDDLRAALASLSVFAGFDAPAAHAVAGVAPSTLLKLSGHSLVKRDGAGRFALHVQVAAYAGEHLEAPRRVALERAHARHFLGWIAGERELRPGCHPPAVVARCRTDAANLALAWRRALAHEPPARRDALLDAALDPAAHAAAALSRYDAFASMCDEALAAIDPATHVGRRLARARLACALALGRHEGAAGPLARLLSSSRAERDEAETSQLELMEAMLAGRRGDFAAALAAVERALACAERAGDDWLATRARLNLAIALWSAGRGGDAEAHAVRALADAERLRANVFHARALRMLGILRFEAGQADLARRDMEASLALFTAMGDAVETAYSLRNLSHLAAVAGDVAAAVDYGRRSLADWSRIGAESEIAEAHFALGFACAKARLTSEAREALGAALAAARRLDFTPLALRALAVLAHLAPPGERAHALATLAFVRAHPALRASDRSMVDGFEAAYTPTEDERARAAERARSMALEELSATSIPRRGNEGRVGEGET